MWAIFTAALTRASSTTRVSLVNTSANFMLTAIAGWAIFGESLNGLWWLGAAGLVVGNVIIGRRDEETEELAKGRPNSGTFGRSSEERREGERERYRDSMDGDPGNGGPNRDQGVELESEEERRERRS